MGLLSGQRDVITGLVSNGRTEGYGAEGVLGLFFNTLPLGTSLPGGTWKELVRQTFESEREMLAHRWYPLAELQKQNAEPFQAVFNYVHFHIYGKLAGVGLQVRGARMFEETNFGFAAHFSRGERPFGISLRLSYDDTLFRDEEIERISGYYRNALESAGAHPDERYDCVSLLSHAERECLIEGWNATAVEARETRTFQQLFAEQADALPSGSQHRSKARR